MSEATKKIRQELGNDAVILNSKEVETGGVLGFFTKKNFEVIAAVDTSPTIRRPAPKRQPPPQKETKIINTLEESKQSIQVEKPNQTEQGLAREVNELKSLVQNMTSSIVTDFDHYPDELKYINQLLIDHDFLPNFRVQIMKKLLKKWYSQDRTIFNSKEVVSWTKELLAESLSDIDLGGFLFNKKYLNLVGPTGVGKTTTIAKIAAHCVIKHKKKVAFITTDTFRIAAIEQLKTYAKILNVPVEVAYSVDDFKLAKQKLASYDLVLIDSAGRNFLNNLYIEELKKVIDFNEEMETYLVLALTSKYRDMATIYEQFSNVFIKKVIFTKKDETFSRGSIFNLIKEYGVGVSYLTNGQNVPDDIVEGSVDELVNCIFEVDDYE